MSRTEAIKNLLSRNVEEAIDRKHLEAALLGGKKLRVKLGIDPTSPDLHLGHAVVLGKLREFQDLGCKIVLIIGDFTGRIGDPSGRSEARKPLSEDDIKRNMKEYLAQAGKIINIKKAEVRYNSAWLGKLKGEEILKLLSLVSAQQLLEREDFSRRFSEHHSIRLHEFLYPIMQGYDSVAIKADAEIGGNDQKLNLLMGRTLMERLGLPSQDVMTVSLLEGLDGVKKMSKSLGNYIGLNETADEMFGKTMSLPDKLVRKYFLMCTGVDEIELKKIEKDLAPRDLKLRLAFEIVKIYHGEKAAAAAQEKFITVFSKKDMQAVALPTLRLKKNKISPLDLVLASGIAKSKSEARRLISAGAVELAGTLKKNPNELLEIRAGQVLKIGKKSFFRIKA